MNVNMGLSNNHNLKKTSNNSKNDVMININTHTHTNKNNKREILINTFIKKFPKVKLHTIIEVNKYYTDNYDQDNNQIKIPNENKIINDYLMS
jgi:hypothetical protein